MLIRKFDFPILEKDGYKAVETKVLELTYKKRNGIKLEPEEEDFESYANTVL